VGQPEGPSPHGDLGPSESDYGVKKPKILEKK